RVSEVPQAGARPGAVPVDERPPVANDEVPRGEILMGDDLVAVGGREHLPACPGRRGEPGDSVMEVADEAGGPAQRCVAVQQVEAAGPGDRAGDEREDLAALVVDAERPGRALVADGVQMGKQRVHRWRPRPGRASHSVAHADNAAIHVAAAERYFGAWHSTFLPGSRVSYKPWQ